MYETNVLVHSCFFFKKKKSHNPAGNRVARWMITSFWMMLDERVWYELISSISRIQCKLIKIEMKPFYSWQIWCQPNQLNHLFLLNHFIHLLHKGFIRSTDTKKPVTLQFSFSFASIQWLRSEVITCGHDRSILKYKII